MNRKRFQVTLYNPLAHGLPNGNRPCATSYKGAASTMRRAFTRAVAASNETFMTAGRDYGAVACFAFEAARKGMATYPHNATRVTVIHDGFSVEIERLV
jgi:hypothetical protein